MALQRTAAPLGSRKVRVNFNATFVATALGPAGAEFVRLRGASITTMIHIIWSGKGFLVAVFTFGFYLVANLISNSVNGSGAYWDTHQWPLAVSLFVSAVACWF